MIAQLNRLYTTQRILTPVLIVLFKLLRAFFYGRWVDYFTNDKRQNVYMKNCEQGNKKSKETRRTRDPEECLWLRDDV